MDDGCEEEGNSLIVEDDIWFPDLSDRDTDLADAIVVVWIPLQHDIFPVLQPQQYMTVIRCMWTVRSVSPTHSSFPQTISSSSPAICLHVCLSVCLFSRLSTSTPPFLFFHILQRITNRLQVKSLKWKRPTASHSLSVYANTGINTAAGCDSLQEHTQTKWTGSYDLYVHLSNHSSIHPPLSINLTIKKSSN